MVTAEAASCRGRRRDVSIDARVLAAANRQLAERGFAALSIAALAQEAGTTRQALYRRWPTKQALVSDAIRYAAGQIPLLCVEDARAELEAELDSWIGSAEQAATARLAGAMLQADTPEAARDCFREHVLQPRERRLRDILIHAQALGEIDPGADIDAAVGIALGAGYAAHLAGRCQPEWAHRTAALIWRALGGAPAGVTA
jgi:AcrR family transcriptional regulator